MPDQENSDNLTGDTNAGAGEQPGDEFLLIYQYRETLEGLSALIINTNWSELTSGAKQISTIEGQLRDVIKNLETLSSEPIGKKVLMDEILKSINFALKELYRAKDLIKKEETNPQLVQALTYNQQDKYDKIESCRGALENAYRLLPSRLKTTIVAPSAQIVSGDGEKTTKAG